MTIEANNKSTVILVTHDGMGSAVAPLQHQLLKTYLMMLLENGYIPTAICFVSEGVKMVVEGSPVIKELRQLSEQGADLIICHTCLSYYHLDDQRQIGIVGGMADIVEAQWKADKVITI